MEAEKRRRQTELGRPSSNAREGRARRRRTKAEVTAGAAVWTGADAGGTLQNYNAELVNCIEELREKREELNKSIAADEEEKAKIQNDLRILTERLARINDNLARKVSSRTEYDKTITETEAAYSKIMESSQTLLHVLKRESVNLTKKKQASS